MKQSDQNNKPLPSNPYLNYIELYVLKASKKNEDESACLSHEFEPDKYLTDFWDNSPYLSDPSTQLFLRPEIKSLIKSLSEDGLLLFHFILMAAIRQTGFVRLEEDIVTVEFCWNVPQLKRTISELEQKKIICFRWHNTWWMNPSIMFCGDLVRYYQRHAPQMIKIQKSEDTGDTQEELIV